MGRDSAQPRGRRGSFRGKHSSRGQHRRPTNEHYYIGGTAEDPLNLNNVGIEPTEDEEVFIPKNKHDPLNLNQSIRKRKLDESHDSTSPTKKVQKVEEPDAAELEKANAAEEAARKKREKKEHFNRKFRYGNFDKYYGVRLGPGEKDPRVMSFNKDWFYKKSVLDIGCNVGFLTLSLAKDFAPRRILGIDIDEHLIGVARKNIRHYCDASTEFAGKYPVSFAKQFGPISGHSLSFSSKFPDNVWFRKENYVFENDESLETVEPEFDVVLALSVTKWIHLNWGDDGMRRFFLRIFKHLLPGGRFILEPQPFQTYSKRAKMTPELWTNYRAIEFKPEDFEMYLLETVGFERVEQLGVPCAKTKGFERPLQVYVKAGGLTTSASPATTVVTTGTVTSPVTVSSTSTVPSNATVSPTATETGSSAPDVEHHPGSPSSIAS